MCVEWQLGRLMPGGHDICDVLLGRWFAANAPSIWRIGETDRAALDKRIPLGILRPVRNVGADTGARCPKKVCLQWSRHWANTIKA